MALSRPFQGDLSHLGVFLIRFTSCILSLPSVQLSGESVSCAAEASAICIRVHLDGLRGTTTFWNGSTQPFRLLPWPFYHVPRGVRSARPATEGGNALGESYQRCTLSPLSKNPILRLTLCFAGSNNVSDEPSCWLHFS